MSASPLPAINPRFLFDAVAGPSALGGALVRDGTGRSSSESSMVIVSAVEGVALLDAGDDRVPPPVSAALGGAGLPDAFALPLS